MAKKWEQQAGEPDRAYARFLAYLYLGPERTLEAAYASYTGSKEIKRDQVSSQWRRECAAYAWVDRASAWDVEQMLAHASEAIYNYVTLSRELSRKALKAIRDAEFDPKKPEQAIAAAELVTKYISAEAPGALYQHRAEPEADTSGSTDV